MIFTAGRNNFININFDKQKETASVSYNADIISQSNWIEECDLFLEDFTGNLFVPLSGGVDSEIVAECIRKTGRKFFPVIMRYKIGRDYFNAHDTDYAFKYSKLNNIEPLVYDLDIEHFFESGKFIEYGIKYMSVSPQFCCHFWLFDQLPGNLILAGDMLYLKNINGKLRPIERNFKYHSFDYYFDKTKRKGCSNFFCHTPTMIARGFEYQKLVYKELGLLVSDVSDYSYITKCICYTKAGLNVYPREKKYTGFERIRKYYDDKYTDSSDVFNQKFRVPLENMVKMPNDIRVHYSKELLDRI